MQRLEHRLGFGLSLISPPRVIPNPLPFIGRILGQEHARKGVDHKTRPREQSIRKRDIGLRSREESENLVGEKGEDLLLQDTTLSDLSFSLRPPFAKATRYLHESQRVHSNCRRPDSLSPIQVKSVLFKGSQMSFCSPQRFHRGAGQSMSPCVNLK